MDGQMETERWLWCRTYSFSHDHDVLRLLVVPLILVLFLAEPYLHTQLGRYDPLPASLLTGML